MAVNVLTASHLRYLIKYLVVCITVVHTHFYIVADTQRGRRTLKKNLKFRDLYFLSPVQREYAYIFILSYTKLTGILTGTHKSQSPGRPDL